MQRPFIAWIKITEKKGNEHRRVENERIPHTEMAELTHLRVFNYNKYLRIYTACRTRGKSQSAVTSHGIIYIYTGFANWL